MENDRRPALKPAVGHEERDTNSRAVILFALTLIVAIVVVLLLMKWVFYALSPPQAEMALPSTAEPGAAAELPPEPRLQVDAPADLKKLRGQEDSVLNSYGWVDRQNGIVRIPIGRAIDLLAQRGLPPHAGTALKPLEK